LGEGGRGCSRYRQKEKPGAQGHLVWQAGTKSGEGAKIRLVKGLRGKPRCSLGGANIEQEGWFKRLENKG